MAPVICPNCGRSTPEGKFCEHCGAQLLPFLLEPVIQVPVPQPVAIAQPQKKKGSVFVKILIVIVIILGMFFAIGIYEIYSEGMIYPINPYPVSPTPAWHLPSDFKTQLSAESYEYLLFPLAKGEKVKVAVSTDGAPIDFLVMDSSNFQVYENTNPTPDTVKYSGLRNIIKDEYTFVAPQYDNYYFVFDNSYWPKSGSNAKKYVWVTAVYTEYY